MTEDTSPSTVETGGAAPPPAPAETAAESPERETPTRLAEAVARRVYELFLQDLRRDRERQGRWW